MPPEYPKITMDLDAYRDIAYNLREVAGFLETGLIPPTGGVSFENNSKALAEIAYRVREHVAAVEAGTDRLSQAVLDVEEVTETVNEGRLSETSLNNTIDAQTASAVDAAMAEYDGGVWTAEAQAAAQGFWQVVSEDPPEVSEMYGVPVVWIPPVDPLTTVPVLPTAPAWNDAQTEYTIPTVVGVDYQLDGDTLAAGTYDGVQGETTTVTAVAASGYYLAGTFEWTFLFTDWSLSTLMASDDFTGSNGTTITGRTLNNALGGTESFAFASYGGYPSGTIQSNAYAVNDTARTGNSFTTSESGLAVELDVTTWATTGDNANVFAVTIGGAGGTVTLDLTALPGYRISSSGGALTGYVSTPAVVGTWKITAYGNVLQLQPPTGSAVTYTLGFSLGSALWVALVRFQNTYPSDWRVDSFKLYSVGS